MKKKKSQTYFIVDDDDDVIAVQVALIEAAGHRALFETSSLDALARMEAEPPDFALLDIMMPEMDGLELCREMRARPEFKNTKITVVSAKAYEFDRKRAFKFGADGFIIKPIDPETFVAQLENIAKDEIEMTFWGVRGTLPVPGKVAFRYGGNTSCVTLEFTKGQFFIFDAGTGIKALSNDLLRRGRTRLEFKIFISHPHWDHINAIPYFAPLYIPGNECEILGASHGDTTMREMISAQMDDIYFPITIKELAARVFFRDLKEGAFEVDGIRVRTLLLSHPGYCLGYRVEYGERSICYATDNELYLPDSEHYNAHYVKKLIEFVDGADALITDCTYTDEEYETKVGWGHSCIGQVIDLAHRAKVKTLYLFHHDPDQDDDAIDRKFQMAQEALKRLGSKTMCVAPAETDSIKI